MRARPITLLSFGGGQNSAALLHKAINDAAFRARFIDGDLVVFMGDTGNEHDATLAYIPEVRELCARAGIPFIYVTRDLGYHTGNWKHGLLGQFASNDTIGSVGFNSSCSESLKIGPIYKALEDFIAREYGFATGRGKPALYAYAARFGKLRVQIGFGAEEVHRLPKPFAQLVLDGVIEEKKPRHRWFAECIELIYPLAEIGFDRAACQDYIRSVGGTVPMPSLCKSCHWKSHAEIEYMRRTDPEALRIWIALERRKLVAWEGKLSSSTGMPIKNYGVKGTTTLEVFVEQATAIYREWTTQVLYEHVFSHGHQVKSKHAA